MRIQWDKLPQSFFSFVKTWFAVKKLEDLSLCNIPTIHRDNTVMFTNFIINKVDVADRLKDKAKPIDYMQNLLLDAKQNR